jgi:hypothetical protein
MLGFAAVAVAASLVALGLVASGAEAQRRNRPGARPRPGAGAGGAASGAPTGADTGSAVDSNPFDPPGGGAPPQVTGGAGGTSGGSGRAGGAPGGGGGGGAGGAPGGGGSGGAGGAPGGGGGAGVGGSASGAAATSIATAASGGASAAGGSSVEGGEEPEPAGPDLGPLKDELTSVMDDLVSTRARISTLGRQLFRTKIRIDVQDRSRSNQSLTRLTVSLDGAQVFRSDGGAVDAASGKRVFEGFAAPGPHTVTVEVEARARNGEVYRYVLRDSFRFEVMRDKLTEVEVRLDGASDIAEDFPDDGEGSYDVRTRFRVATRDLSAR